VDVGVGRAVDPAGEVAQLAAPVVSRLLCRAALHRRCVAFVAMTTAAVEDAGPGSRPAASWQARHAAFKSRGVSDDDPRVRECLEALAYHRVRRVLDAEITHLGPEGWEALARMLEAGAVQ
jgi:hypothetical protein